MIIAAATADSSDDDGSADPVQDLDGGFVFSALLAESWVGLRLSRRSVYKVYTRMSHGVVTIESKVRLQGSHTNECTPCC